MSVRDLLRYAVVIAAAIVLWNGSELALDTAGASANTHLSVGETGTVVLGHPKPKAAAAPQRNCGGGGLAGKTECDVTQNIKTGGGDSATAAKEAAAKPTSTVVFELAPVLERTDGAHRVRLDVNKPRPQFAPDIGRGAKRRLTIEAQNVEKKLKEWRLDLTAEQVAALQQAGELPVDVVGPFDGLRLWNLVSRGPLAVRLEEEPEVILVLDVLTLDPLGPDLPFRARLTYEETPAQAPTMATAKWEGGSIELPLRASGSRKVFLSDWYYLNPRSVLDHHDMPGFNGEPEKSARTAAELFTGRWDVVQSGGELDGALGIAVVSDDGRDVRLFLQAGEEKRRYESFEIEATNDTTGGRHTLNIRFQRKPEGAPWGPSVKRQGPEGRVLFVADGVETMSVEAEGQNVDTAITLPKAQPERFRVGLWIRSPGAPLSGAWHPELPNGNLGDGGQQTWGRATTIEEAVVIEDQRLIVKPVGSFDEFVKDPAPHSADYIRAPPPPRGDRTTEYPFKNRDTPENDRKRTKDLTHRTLLIYGKNLPQKGADALVLKSGDEQITYELVAFPSEGKERLFEAGWRKAEAENRDDFTALLLRAKFTAKVGTGVKTLSINGAPAAWHLDFMDANAGMGFAHRWREHEDTGEGVFDLTATPFTGDVVYLVLDEQAPLPLDGIAVELRLNGTPLEVNETKLLVPVTDGEAASDTETQQDGAAATASEGAAGEATAAAANAAGPDAGAGATDRAGSRPQIETLVAKRFGSPTNAEYRSPAIRLSHRGRPNRSPPPEDNALTLEVVPGDVLTAQMVNPFLLRSLPRVAKAEIVASPGALGSTWKQALTRAATCYGEQEIDFDNISSQEVEAYSKHILTEGLTDDLKALFAGRVPEVSPLILVNPVAYSLRERKVFVSRGDHAAAILIRDEFVRMMQGPLKDLRAIAIDDQKLWQFYQARKTSSLAFWDITRVKQTADDSARRVDAIYDQMAARDPLRGMVSQDTRELMKDIVKRLVKPGDDDDWVIGDLVENVAGAPGSSRAAHLYAFGKTREALFSLLERAANAEARARDAGDCKLDELLLIAGQDADSVVTQILPRLVRLARDRNRQFWEPDLLAQKFVASLKVKGAEVRALKQYGRIDDGYKAMALAAATAGASFALTAAGALIPAAVATLIGDGLDAAVFGGDTFEQYLSSEPLVEYGEGASLVLGPGFYDEANAMRVEGWEAALGFLGPAVGGAASARSIGNIQSAARGARLLKKFEYLDNATIAGLSKPAQADLMAHFADLRTRRPAGRWTDPSTAGRALTAAESADFEKFASFYRANGMDVTGPRMRILGTAAGDVAGAGSGPLGSAGKGGPITGSPAGGKTGIERQQYCVNCGYVAAEGVLKDARIIPTERSQAGNYALAQEHGLIGAGGARADQLADWFELNGVPKTHTAVGPHRPADLDAAWRNGRDSLALIQNGSGGYHWVRVEGFTTDANGTRYVSYGEGGASKGQSIRKTTDEFDRLTRAYANDPLNAGQRLRSVVVDTPNLKGGVLEAAKADALVNAATGRALVRREALRLGLTEDEMEAVLFFGPGAPPRRPVPHQPTAGNPPTGGAVPDDTPTVIGNATPLPEAPSLPQRQTPRETPEATDFPATEAQLRTQARENAAAAAEKVRTAMQENRALSDLEKARVQQAITANNLQQALDEVIAEARKVGVSEDDLASAIGNLDDYGVSPVATREVALRSVEGLRLAREGFEIVTGQAARTFHEHSTRILSRNAGNAEVE